jgi:excisionase family DNA binding protein
MRNEALHHGAKAMPMQTTEALFNRKQTAALFGVSTQTIIRLENAGNLPVVRIGTSIRYRRSDIEKFTR